MAKHIKKLVLVVTLDSSEAPTAVKVLRYRVEDSESPGVRQPESARNVAMVVGDMNKTMHNAGTVGEVVKDCVDACRTDAGL